MAGQIQVCKGRTCRWRGAGARLKEIEDLADSVGGCIVRSSRCMGMCERGPCVRRTGSGRSEMHYRVADLKTSAKIVEMATGKTPSLEMVDVREQNTSCAKICTRLLGGGGSPPKSDQFVRWHLKAVTVMSKWSAIYHCTTSNRGRGSVPRSNTWHIMLCARSGAKETIERAYTPVSTADEWGTGHCDLLIKIYPDGQATSWLHTQSLGTELLLSPPKSTLQFPSLVPEGDTGALCSKSILLVAGGTGIAPAWQILDGCRANSMRNIPVTLIYSCRKDDLLMAELLAAFAEQNKQSRVIMNLTDPISDVTPPFPDFVILESGLRENLGDKLRVNQGRIDRELLQHEVSALPMPLRVVVSGPELMNSAVHDMLVDVGLATDSITLLEA